MVAQEEFKESIFDMDLETLIPESTCNTRKVKNFRYDIFKFYSFEFFGKFESLLELRLQLKKQIF